MRIIALMILVVTLSNCSGQKIEHDLNCEGIWMDILQKDQKYRGRLTKDSVDNANFKEMILQISRMNYPSADDCGYVASLVPSFVFTHQRSEHVRKHYFPIFIKAYQEGRADTTRFIANLGGVYKDHYGRPMKRGRQPTPEECISLWRQLGYDENQEVDYNVKAIDSLFEQSKEELTRILGLEQLGEWSD